MLGLITILSSISWALGPSLPRQARQSIEAQIHRDLQKRAHRHKSEIADTQIHFGEMQAKDHAAQELIYAVEFDEKSSNGTSHYLLKKKLVLNKSWQVISIQPVAQEIRVESGSDIQL